MHGEIQRVNLFVTSLQNVEQQWPKVKLGIRDSWAYREAPIKVRTLVEKKIEGFSWYLRTFTCTWEDRSLSWGRKTQNTTVSRTNPWYLTG